MDMSGQAHHMYRLQIIPLMCRELQVHLSDSEWDGLCAPALARKSLAVLTSTTPCIDTSSSPPAMSGSLSTSSDRNSNVLRAESQSSFVASSSERAFDAASSIVPSESSETVHELQDKIRQLEADNQRLKKRCRSKAQHVNRLQHAIEDLKGSLGVRTFAALKRKHKKDANGANRQFAIQKKGRCERNLSDSGIIAVAIRMSLSCCSAIGFPAASWADISRQTVSRCEVTVAAACNVRAAIFGHIILHLFATTNNFFTLCRSVPYLKKCLSVMKPFLPSSEEGIPCEADLALVIESFLTAAQIANPRMIASMCTANDKTDGTKGLRVAGISIQNDATNSSIWQRKKLTTAVVHLGLLVDADALALGDRRKAFLVDAFM